MGNLDEVEANDAQNWPRVQHRFRAFPSRYYHGTQEDFYFAAALTEEEFKDYETLCGTVGQTKCEGFFGYYPHSESTQIGLQDTCEGMAQDKAQACGVLHQKVLTIFSSVLAWTNVPARFWGNIVRGARMSAFKIFFLNARHFALTIPHHERNVLAFAVGDAAMDVHFFSGSGVNMGFKAARLLCDLLGHWNGSPAYDANDNPADVSGLYAASVHQEARAFAFADHPNQDAKVTGAKGAFIQYDNGLPAPVHTTWLDDNSLLQEYHHIMSVALLHKHMEASYNVLHAATYRSTVNACEASPKTCLPCPALTCAADDVQCLWPVTDEAIALTENQHRIMDFITRKPQESNDLGTNCVLRETYG